MFGARLEQVRRAQQAADVVGAERRSGGIGHVDSIANSDRRRSPRAAGRR
jgi:hypothetical protein